MMVYRTNRREPTGDVVRHEWHVTLEYPIVAMTMAFVTGLILFLAFKTEPPECACRESIVALPAEGAAPACESGAKLSLVMTYDGSQVGVCKCEGGKK